MPRLHHDTRGAGAAQVVLLALGAIFAVGGIWAFTQALACQSLLSGTGLGSACSSEEVGSLLVTGLGIVLVLAALVTWNGKKRSRRMRRSKAAISTAHSVILGFGLTVLAIGVLLIVVAGGFYSPTPIVLLVLGAVLTFLGVAETFIETEGRHRK